MQFRKSVTRFTAGLLLVSTLVTPALAVSGTVDVGSSRLRLRADSNTKSAVLASLRSGTELEVLAPTDNGWYQVSYKGTVGYVSGKYLNVDAAALAAELAAKAETEQSAPAETPAETTPTETPAETTPAETPVETPAETPAEAPAETPVEETAPAEETKLYARVTTSVLNIRSGPSTSSKKVGKLSAGRVVEVLATENGWYKIPSGYISADYAILVDPAEAQAAGKGQEIADYALTFIGTPYVYGGSSPKGFDCSGFTQYVYKHFGYKINRTASNQLDNGTPVSMSELLPGDLVMFKKAGTGNKRASHVGIYIGNGQFVHASSPKVDTIVSDLSDSYYTTGFVGGRRIV